MRQNRFFLGMDRNAYGLKKENPIVNYYRTFAHLTELSLMGCSSAEPTSVLFDTPNLLNLNETNSTLRVLLIIVRKYQDYRKNGVKLIQDYQKKM